MSKTQNAYIYIILNLNKYGNTNKLHSGDTKKTAKLYKSKRVWFPLKMPHVLNRVANILTETGSKGSLK